MLCSQRTNDENDHLFNFYRMKAVYYVLCVVTSMVVGFLLPNVTEVGEDILCYMGFCVN